MTTEPRTRSDVPASPYADAEGATAELPRPAAEVGPAAPSLRSRRRWLYAVLAAAALLALGGLLSPLVVKSPQELAAEAKPPPATVLTAPVESRILRDTVVMRGDVKAEQSIAVTPGSRGEGKPILTAVRVSAGDPVAAGSVVLEVSGRPLIVLPGTVPAYRDLKPGAEGKDIAQLQHALASLGFTDSDKAGYFGGGTKHALTAFYASRGYQPLPVNDSDEAQLASAQQQITEANRVLADARDAKARVDGDPTATAQQRSDAAKAVTRATEDLAAAQGRYADLDKVTGPMLPQNEYTFLPAFPARVDAVNGTVGADVVAPLVTFSSGPLVVKASLTEAQHALVKVGQHVEVNGDGGLSAAATVTSVGALTTPGQGGGNGAAGQDAPGYPTVITPDPAITSQWVGQNVRLSIEVASSDGAQLVVPVSAIYAAADGAVYVTKRTAAGEDVRIAVVPGMSAQGYVAISVPGGGLAPGDLVTVGTR